MIWDERGLALAQHVASWSKDPSTQVGAVIFDSLNRHVATGYNGFPRFIADDGRLDIRDIKYEMIVHAEINAIINARSSVQDCTLYTWPMLPCSRCASVVIQSGISRVVAPENTIERWQENITLAVSLFAEAGIIVKEIKRSCICDSVRTCCKHAHGGGGIHVGCTT